MAARHLRKNANTTVCALGARAVVQHAHMFRRLSAQVKCRLVIERKQ
jgi:hypothetical protein